MDTNTDMELDEVQCIMATLALEGGPIHITQVQTQLEPLETDSSDDTNEGVKALTFEIEFKPQPDSPLLRLPGELRNKIYGYLYDHSTVQVACYERKLYTLYTCYHSAILQVTRQIRKEAFSLLLEHAKFYVRYQDLGALCRRFEGADRITTLAIDIRNCDMHDQPCNSEWMIKRSSPLCKNGKLQRIMIKGDMGPRLFQVGLDLDLDLPGKPDGKRVRVEEVPDLSNLLCFAGELGEREANVEQHGQEGEATEKAKTRKLRRTKLRRRKARSESTHKQLL